jgi:hypothetical protein
VSHTIEGISFILVLFDERVDEIVATLPAESKAIAVYPGKRVGTVEPIDKGLVHLEELCQRGEVMLD